MGQWCDLPENLLQTIEKDHMALYADKVRIRAVCVSWNSYLPKMLNQEERQFPWLLQALDNNEEASHALFNPIEKKFYLLDLPEAQGKLFKGSSHGWVTTVEDTHSTSPTAMYLINPLTRARIKLPSRNKFPDVRKYRADKVDQEYCISYYEEESKRTFIASDSINFSCTDKVVMSSSPFSDDCLIVAIYGLEGILACCKLNDKRWKPLRVKVSRPSYSHKTETRFVDIIFHKGKLHALLESGKVLKFENYGVGPYPNVTEIARGLPYSIRTSLKYLVEGSDGGLIMVARYLKWLPPKGDVPIPRTYCFRVFKLDSINSNWVEVKNIGDDILFLGLNSSVSISFRHIPEYKRNRIYFTDTVFSFEDSRQEQEDSDIGVFNLAAGTIQSLSGLKCRPKFLWPPPIWVNMG